MMADVRENAVEAGLQIVTPLWGAAYARVFTDLCLPALLAPGNIPALPHPERHAFQIFTTPEDRAIIEASPAFAALTRYMRVEFHPLRARAAKIGDKYMTQSDCYRRAIARADDADQALVLLNPDLFVADGGLLSLARIARSGARAILGAGIRLDKDRIAAQLSARHRSADGSVIAIGPRDLVRLALSCLHPIAQAHCFDGTSDEFHPANLYWRVGEEGLVAHCVSFHPYLIHPRIKHAPFTSTIDDDFIEAACPDPADTHVITDSDAFVAFELSDLSYRINTMRRTDPLRDTLAWTTDKLGSGKVRARTREFLNHAIRIHTGIRDEALWTKTEAEARRAVTTIVSHLDRAGATRTEIAAAPKISLPLQFVTSISTLAEAQRFVDIGLPSLLAPGNIPLLPNRQQCVYKVYAPADCRALIERAPAFKVLQEYLRAEFRDPPSSGPAGIDRSCAPYTCALREAARDASAMMAVPPNALFANRSLRALGRVIDRGMRGVLVASPRLAPEIAELLRHDYLTEGVIAVEAAELAALAAAHLDAGYGIASGGGEHGSDPAELCWKVGDEGLLLHCFHLRPAMIAPRSDHAVFSHAVTAAMVQSAGLGGDEVAVIRDSRAFVQCAIGDGNVNSSARTPAGVDAIAAWAAANADPLQRHLLRQGVRFETTPERGLQWLSTEARASGTVLEILAKIAMQPRIAAE